ncbi:glycosyltransferase family 4 protein, partial [Ilumatobacter sp.]|uniref:glycosyltransferase family 4 protein n=1 Tax=Ilumatobacter sp. TaxID=1967498 RepID=UPI003AF4AD84
PYLVSFRSTAHSGHRKLPLPGIVASHVWSRLDLPRADRWLDGADVLHGTNYLAPPSSLPTVVSVYDCWFLAHPDLASPVVRRAGAALRRRVAAGAWIHASSDATADRVRDLLATERVRTVHLGAPDVDETTVERPAVADDLGSRPFVVCVATEERRKGLRLLVDAFDLLARDHPEVALVLAGAAGDDSDAVTAAIDRTGRATRSRIHRIGVVDESAKRWLVRHAAVLAYPSVDEGFGFPVLEAQVLATPVVATSVGSVTEVAGDAAELVDGRDPSTFAEAIDRVLADDARRLALIEAGRRNVERFRWDTAAGHLTDLYRDAVADR